MYRTTLLLVCMLFTSFVYGQSRKRSYSSSLNNQQTKFLEKQWWLGFKAGTNLIETDVMKRYSILTPINYPASEVDKYYESFQKPGMQAMLEATFYMKGLSISLQPTYRYSIYVYSNEYQWTNPDNVSEYLILNYEQEQRLDFIDLPLILKYDILKGKIRPFIQAGIYYSALINATKEVIIKNNDFASGGVNTISSEPVIIGAKDLFTGYWGWMTGAGINYNLGNIRFVLEANYWKGMSNISNTENRYSNDRLSGIGEAQDDLKLNSIIISTGILFPMRFLSNSFNTLDR